MKEFEKMLSSKDKLEIELKKNGRNILGDEEVLILESGFLSSLKDIASKIMGPASDMLVKNISSGPIITDKESLDSLVEKFPNATIILRKTGREWAEKFIPEKVSGEDLKSFFDNIGIGELEIEEMKKHKATLILKNSGEAFIEGRASCPLSSGIITAFLEKYAGEEVKVEETKCIAKGDEHCKFEMKTKAEEFLETL